MTEKKFSSLKLEKKLELLKSEGEFIGNRLIPSYQVSLFAFSGFYVEMFVIRHLNQVHWIEIQTNAQILLEYTKNINLGDLPI